MEASKQGAFAEASVKTRFFIKKKRAFRFKALFSSPNRLIRSLIDR